MSNFDFKHSEGADKHRHWGVGIYKVIQENIIKYTECGYEIINNVCIIE